LPDALRGEQYAFVALPVSEFRKGGSIDNDNVGLGRLCPIDPTIPDDAMIQGLAVFTK
jgi:RNA-binding protein Tab2/Atab2